MAYLASILSRAEQGERLGESDIVRLFKARGDDFIAVCQAADRLRQKLAGDEVTYCVNRNINYTNVCYFKCQFCAFSKGKMSENCLLYTSPSPRDATLSRMPSSA